MWLRLFIFAVMLPSMLTAADGDIDINFGNAGTVITDLGGSMDWARSVAIQNDGKIIVAGSSYNGSDYDFALVRYNTNGTLDTTFSGDGKVITDMGGSGEANSVAIQSDGRIVVAGYARISGDFDYALARYNVDGTLDATFSNDGKVITDITGNDDVITDIKIQNDGKIVVVGHSYSGSAYSFTLARYDTSGILDTAFNCNGKVITHVGGFDDKAYGITIQNDGKIIVAGSALIDGDYYFALARYNPNGDLDTAFDSDGKVITSVGNYDDSASSITIQDDGKIVVAGNSYNGNTMGSISYFALVRYSSNGALDTTFGGDGKVTTDVGGNNDKARSITIQHDGKIIVAGSSFNGSDWDFSLARYTYQGALDITFGSDGKVITDVGGGDDAIYNIAMQGNGKIVAVGYSSDSSSIDFALARYQGNSITLSPIYYLLQ